LRTSAFASARRATSSKLSRRSWSSTAQSSTPFAVRRLERLALAAWPAPVVEQLGGWVLRCAHGVTGRANSVWTAEDDGTLGLDDKIEAAERFYERHGVGPRLQLTPLSEQGASHAYLQVEETNIPARALYDQYGFEIVYPYVYRFR
jgi:GNAT superfamily N-acetyltransferase